MESCVSILMCLEVFSNFFLDFFIEPLVFSGTLFILYVFVISLHFLLLLISSLIPL